MLGTGGFAAVYRGWQRAVGREVAIKVDNRVLFSERDRRRFFREVTAAGRLSGHPHVVDVYDAGMLADGRPYLVMELCPGGSLNDELRRNGPMSPPRVAGIGVRLADALAAAHAAGVLHRDIKPANVLINRYGVVGLADFGLASIIAASGEQTVTRDALTPAFAPPESFRGADPTAAADIYSLAATLYMLLAGRPPRFPAGEPAPGLATIVGLHDRPVQDVPGTPPELMAILRQALAADPAERPATAAALRDALAALRLSPDAESAPQRQPAASDQASGSQPPQGNQPAMGVPATGGYWVSAGSPGPLGYGADSTSPSQAGAHVGPAAYAGAAGLPSAAGHPVTGPSAHPAGPGPGSHPGTGPGFHPGADLAGPTGPAAPSAGRRRTMALAAALGGGIAVIVIAALFAGAHFFGPGGTPGPVRRGQSPVAAGSASAAGTASGPGVFGVATVTSGCPAAAGTAGARCPARPECWDGIVEIAGNTTVQSLPCTGPHVWETFAIGILPAAASTSDTEIVAKDPTVRGVCSVAVLLQSRAGAARQIPAASWDIEVVPPDDAAFASGARAYRCLAHVLTGPGPAQSQFLR
jgi:hypothetical protein